MDYKRVQRILLGWWKCSKSGLWQWLHNLVDHQVAHFKCLNFMDCKVYLNQDVEKEVIKFN